MRCEECGCWQRREDVNNFGYCKARAPMPTIYAIIGDVKHQIIWPSTGKDDYCVKDFIPK